MSTSISTSDSKSFVNVNKFCHRVIFNRLSLKVKDSCFRFVFKRLLLKYEIEIDKKYMR